MELAVFVSEANNKNILVDENLRNENIVFIVNDKQDFFLEAFEKALNLKGLELIKNEKFYFVKKPDDFLELEKYRTIKLNFVKFEDIENLLKLYDLKYEFIKSSKILAIKSKETDFNSLAALITEIDKYPNQLKLKITIIETDLNELKELGSDTSKLILDENSNLFLNLVSYPFSVTNVLTEKQAKGFYSYLKFLNSKRLVTIHSNPILTLSDNKETFFSVGSNIPFKTSSTDYQDTLSRNTSTVDYRDVGTEIKITPAVYDFTNVYLDLDIGLSNVVKSDDMYPITNKKSFKQSLNLKGGSFYFLTGINKKDVRNSEQNIPLLSEIPVLGWLFKYESKQFEDINLTIILELIDDTAFHFSKFEDIKF
ncbi:type II secretion system protein GspD [Aliarcobacter cryaerophilus]|uniref:type II secretion system protein GspD n=1 Tax=Aliarcobacter cryaerophilus TaxID=28198 RepID=UPI003DA6C86E